MAKMLRALIIFAFLDAFSVDALFGIRIRHPKTLKEMYARMIQDKPQQYLDAHNAIRLIMGVPPLQWDKSLERHSRKYANSQAHICHLRHSHGRFGENLAWELYDEASPHDIVQKFIDEQANYDIFTGVCRCPPTSPDCMCGHFTQVIWRTTERVGCAEVTCKGDRGRLVVCSYDPPGNVIGQHPLHPFVSLIGPDGWCVHFETNTRTCSIYADRPYFCRVEPDIFEQLYGIENKKFNKEACSSCIDTIKAIYGSQSKELDNFNHAIRGKNEE